MAAYVAQELTYLPFRKPWIISNTVSNKHQKLASRWKQWENQSPCVPLVGREDGVPHWLTWWLLKSLNTQVVETDQWIKASLESIKGSGRWELAPQRPLACVHTNIHSAYVCTVRVRACECVRVSDTPTLIKQRVVGQGLAIALLPSEVDTTALTRRDIDTTYCGCRTTKTHCNRVRGFPAG